MLKESATGIRVQGCEGDKNHRERKKRKRKVKEKLEEGKKETSKGTCGEYSQWC